MMLSRAERVINYAVEFIINDKIEEIEKIIADPKDYKCKTEYGKAEITRQLAKILNGSRDGAYEAEYYRDSHLDHVVKIHGVPVVVGIYTKIWRDEKDIKQAAVDRIIVFPDSESDDFMLYSHREIQKEAYTIEINGVITKDI